MTATSDTRSGLERDITEALLRLRLARAERDREQATAWERRLNLLLDGWGN